MASGAGSGESSKVLAGKKRKAAVGRGDAPARREARRGLGVAALESIRAQLETAENFYVFPSLSTPAAAPPLPPPPTPLPSLVGHVPGVQLSPYVGNGAAQRDFYTPYYGAQHYTNHAFTRILQASISHVVPRQNHQVVQNDVVVATAPPLEQQDHRRRAQTHQHRRMRRPQVAFVDLVDSDDEDDASTGAGEEELDLELKL